MKDQKKIKILNNIIKKIVLSFNFQICEIMLLPYKTILLKK